MKKISVDSVKKESKIKVNKKENMNADHENNNEFVYDTLKLLQLLESISTTTESTILQSKINLYLKDLLSVEYVLIVPLLPATEETQEGLIQVVNDNVLEKEFRFSVSVCGNS